MADRDGDTAYCWNCGSVVDAQVDACAICGADQTETPFEATRPPAGDHPPSTAQQQSGNQEATGGDLPRSDASIVSFAALAHIVGLVSLIVGPLLIYALASDEYTKRNAANATNWWLTVTIFLAMTVLIFGSPVELFALLDIEDIGLLVLALLALVLMAVVMTFILSVLLLLAPIFSLIGTAKAAKGQLWSYPFSIPLL